MEKESGDNLSLDDDFAEMHSSHSIMNVKIRRHEDKIDLPVINYKYVFIYLYITFIIKLFIA